MPKKPVAVLFTDLHIEDSNAEDCVDIAEQALLLALSLGVSVVLNAGDSFNTRKHQSMPCLLAFAKILDLYWAKSVVMIAIDGNHDKLMYNSQDSYLDVYAKHPAIKLVKTYEYNVLNKVNNDRDRSDGVKISMVSFFSDNNQCTSNEQYVKYLKSVALMTETHPNSKHILVTHHGFNGARTNSGTLIETDISTKHVGKFNKVLVGHYHDASVVGSNVTYVGACRQGWFTENKNKGFTIIYDDGSIEHRKSYFREYTEIDVKLEGEYVPAINNAIKSLLKKRDKGYVDYYKRIHLIGDNSSLRSVDINAIKLKGIDVRTTDITNAVGSETGDIDRPVFVSFDEASVSGLFMEFLEEEGIESEEAIEYGINVLGRAVTNYKQNNG